MFSHNTDIQLLINVEKEGNATDVNMLIVPMNITGSARKVKRKKLCQYIIKQESI
jgi:hypothetical protein